MSTRAALVQPPYADADDARTMGGDARVASLRMGLPDPRDRHLLHSRLLDRAHAPAATGRADEAAARVAARLGL